MCDSKWERKLIGRFSVITNELVETQTFSELH